MNPLGKSGYALVVTLALTILGACSYPFSHDSVTHEQTNPVVAVPRDTRTDTIFAVVTAIDLHSGLVVLDSARGRLLTTATPAQLHELHPGDLVLVYLSNDGQSEERPQEEQSTDALKI